MGKLYHCFDPGNYGDEYNDYYPLILLMILYSSQEPLMRDFTYIDDVIDGLMSIVELLTKHHVNCGSIYNLGYGSPVAVETMVSYLEEELDKKASLVIIGQS